MKLRAPTGDGEVLAVPGFHAVPAHFEANRRLLNSSGILIDGIPLPELRKLARAELCLPGLDVPLIVTGHQPELSHPGVWAKNFAANGLARRVSGVALNLIADTDTMKTASVKLPLIDSNDATNVQLISLPFDDFTVERPYELARVANPELFRSFPMRLAEATRHWPVEASGVRSWPRSLFGHTSTHSDLFAALRREAEQVYKCNNIELYVSVLSQSVVFRHFVKHVAEHRVRFNDCYNDELQNYRREHRVRSSNHPAPDLVPGELPFWRITERGREKVFDTAHPEELRPRAFTLTMFARLVLGDYFLHGLGGGLYDRVTDEILRRFFQIEPPTYQLLTATLHLPFPAGLATQENYERWRHYHRHQYWNPHYHLLGRNGEAEMAQHRAIIAMPVSTHRQRLARFAAFREFSARLRPAVADRMEIVQRAVSRSDREARAQAILTRRDYAWILHPEKTLKPFLQQFLLPDR